jgi:hypothetical protein
MKLVLVRWLDAYSHESGWKAIEKVRRRRAPLVKSVGYVVKRTPTEITLAASIVGDECDGDVIIPMGMVRDIKELSTR